MATEKESPGGDQTDRGSKRREIDDYVISIITQGQVEKLAFILALTPYLEMILPAVIVAFVMGAL